jgi:ABC-type lipoprotein release transport system permease subunit
MASVFFGVILSVVMTSMQYGSYDSMIDNVVKFYSGYAQVFKEEYNDNKTINNTLSSADSVAALIGKTEGIEHAAPRLEYFALASSEELTKGAVILGIDPVLERYVTDVGKWLQEGRYLEPGDPGVLVSVNLARYLNTGIGDTLILYGQGYHGVTAAGLFPVRGILNFPLPVLNNQMIYMDLATCQQFFSAENRATSLVVMVEDHYQLPEVMKKLRQTVASPLKAMSWDELQPELVQMIEADRAGGVFMKVILYMVIAFGIIGTIIMMMAERIREIGVTIAIGMQRYTVATILFIETILTGLLGAILGIAGSIPVVFYFYRHPIRLTGNAADTMIEMGLEPLMYFSLNPFIFYDQAITVFIIAVIVGLYPMVKTFRLKVNAALKA